MDVENIKTSCWFRWFCSCLFYFLYVESQNRGYESDYGRKRVGQESYRNRLLQTQFGKITQWL